MKIGLLGYGKMGHAVEAEAIARDHEIAWRIGWSNRAELTSDLLRQADVVVEFSRPDAALSNVLACLQAGVPVVSGTTGWADQLPQAEQYCREHGGALLWASNFSVGVNLFFALNRYLARLMDARDEYAPSLEETHHVHKLDAPSGTAQTLANDLVAAASRIKHWLPANGQPAPPDALPVTSIRRGEIPGTHIVRWDSPIDTLEIRHTAHSRAGFAAGAVLAAEWILGKKGVFRMSDVLNLSNL
ncbi:MAG: 4-hydroxy-tetrahydrodipicolinate reductase [Saprospiraceae bacterium]|nr:4-hydroxy-tetrahydrodipicolinate reductase [Saprospiraceae bacterium]